MKKILIIEDSITFTQLLKDAVKSKLDFDVVSADSYSKAKEILDKRNLEFFVCLVDLNLPDAPDGEALDLVIEHNLPAIVFTGDYSEDTRKKCWQKMVVDYVIKEGLYNIDYIITLIKRINLNKSINVLVVDDSRTKRTYISNLLLVHQYNVIEAVDGNEALKQLEVNPDIKMVITDHNMPGMSGFELLKKIRKEFKLDDLSVIGISSRDDDSLSARFIKNGANDFIKTPFNHEEFYCRVTQNITLLEKIIEIKESANRDYLTGLYNRRYFFNAGKLMHSNAERENLQIIIAMIDIDFFKKINDSYGHDAGDIVLKKVALKLKNRFRTSDIVARFGGEEFCVIAGNLNKEMALGIFNKLKEDIDKNEIHVSDYKIDVTVSIGITTKLYPLDEMIKNADNLLYEAKNTGRNKVVIDL